MAFAEKRGEEGEGRFPWRARWLLPPDGSGRKRYDSEPGFATREAALEYGRAKEQEQAVDLRRGDYHDRSRGEITLDDYFWKKWLPAQRISERSRANRRGEYRVHISPRWGSTPLNALDPFELAAFENQIRANLSQSLGGNVMELLWMMLDDAVHARLLKSMPMLPRRGRRGTKVTSDARVGQVTTVAAVETIGSRLPAADRTLVRVKMFTGMRWGEVAGMRRQFLVLESAKADRPACGHYVIDPLVGALHQHPVTSRRSFGPPKTPESARTVGFAPVVAEWLLAHLETIPRQQDVLFVNGAGQPLNRGCFNRKWRPACDGWPAVEACRGRRAVAAAAPAHQGLVLHDLRHSFKTWAAEDGIEKRVRDVYLGHLTGDMDGVYIHPTEAMLARLHAAVQRRWEAYVASVSPNVLPFRAA